jgi:pilus assembly protein Flp/PilA
MAILRSGDCAFFSRRTKVSTIKKIASDFMKDESGQDLIEYALVACIIALGAVTVMNTLASTISTAFSTISTKLSTAI